MMYINLKEFSKNMCYMLKLNKSYTDQIRTKQYKGKTYKTWGHQTRASSCINIFFFNFRYRERS